jgi:hypothetical protein
MAYYKIVVISEEVTLKRDFEKYNFENESNE